MKARDVLKSDKFLELYPGRVEFKKDMDLKQSYQNTANGVRVSAGVGGGVTGLHAHILLVDDPLNPKQAASTVEVKNASDWLTKTLSTRKVDKQLTPTILIMQRLAEDDPTGHLLEKGNRVRHICLPAEISDLDNVKPSQMEKYYIDGLLDPKRMSRETLAAQRVYLGSRDYAGQFLQNPAAAEGDLVKRVWWQWYDYPEGLPQTAILRETQSWDTAHKKGQNNDPSVCTTWKSYTKGHFLIDGWEDKVLYPDLKKQAILQNNVHTPDTILVEDRSSGQDLVPDLLDGTLLPVKAVPVSTDKTARVNTCSTIIENGKVFLPRGYPFAEKLVDQFAGFPNLKHDDIVDSVTLFLNWIRQFSTKEPVFHSLPRREINNLLQGY